MQEQGLITGERRPAASRAGVSLFAPERRALLAFVVSVLVVGAIVLADAAVAIRHVQANVYLIVLGVLIIASGRFVIKVPGRPATVSVSEVFVFATTILFGPAPATLIVACDGAWISCTQKDRRLYRALFNVAEASITTWTSGQVFFAIAGVPTITAQSHATGSMVALGAVGMAATFFLLNSSLTSFAIALENRASAYEVWKGHALYLSVNCYAAASLATLAVANPWGLSPEVVGLVVPLLVLSYVAYREASTRVDDAQRHVAEVRHLYQATVEMLAIAVEGKDRGTHGHVRRVQRHARAVATSLGVTDDVELKAIEAGSLLHDIGKLVVPDHILNKPGALTRLEYDTMKRHASMGARILTAVAFPYPVVPIVRHHHEHWDGHGYPDGLVRSEIPLGARILAVVDCFDALTSDRPYRQRLSDDHAIEILRGRSGTFYDPAVVDAFIALIPALRAGDRAAEAESEVLGSVMAGIAQASDRHSRPSDPNRVMSPLAPMTRAASTLIDDQVGRIPSAEACLFAVNSAGDALYVAHATKGLREAVGSLEFTVGQGLSGWVVANRSTIRNADPVLDFGELATRLGLRSCTSTPVFVEGELAGALTIYLPTAGGFTDQQSRFVGVLAQEVGLLLARSDTTPHEISHLAAGGRGSIALVS